MRLAVALATCAGLTALGLRRQDRLLWQVAILSAIVGLLGLPLAVQQFGDVTLASLVTQLGFVLLLIGFLRSLHGSWFREQWLAWWGEEIGPESPRP